MYYISRLVAIFWTYLRKYFYLILSDNKLYVKGRGQPVLFKGKGRFVIGKNSFIGVESSPFYFSGYSYLEARTNNDLISIGENSHFNNGLRVIAFNGNISIGDNCLIGLNFSAISSDFHDLSPAQRFSPVKILSSPIVIGNNVFIGNDVSVLKGVEIGDNSVIASGSVVSKSIPSNVIAGGNPARVIREL